MDSESIGLSDVFQNVTLQSISTDCLYVIFEYLDPESFHSVGHVNKYFRYITESNHLMWKQHQYIWKQIHHLTVSSLAHVENISVNMNVSIYSSNPHVSSRLKFIQNSLNELKELSSSLFVKDNINKNKNKNKTDTINEFYYTLLVKLYKNVHEIENLLRKTVPVQHFNDDIFDLMDFHLRKKIDELEKMFWPSNLINSGFQLPNGSISSIIVDQKVRALWNKLVGEETYYITMDNFFEIFQLLFPDTILDKTFFDCVNFLVNFPKDDYVSVYKWGVLFHQFGNTPELVVDNIKKYVCGYGFLGPLNAIASAKMIEHSTNQYFFRFSRSEPSRITITYNWNGIAKHLRIPCKRYHSITNFVNEFDKELLSSNMSLVQMKIIIGDNCVNFQSISDYKLNGYLCPISSMDLIKNMNDEINNNVDEKLEMDNIGGLDRTNSICCIDMV